LKLFFIESDDDDDENKNKKENKLFFSNTKKKCSGIADVFSKRKSLIMNLKFDTY